MAGPRTPSIVALFNLVRDEVFRLRTSYKAESRFVQLRIRALSLFGADIVFTILFAVAIAPSGKDLEAWFEVGFPSNLVIIRSHDRRGFVASELVLDNRYRTADRRISPGTSGIEIVDFADKDQLTPDGAYRPQHLTIRTEDETVVLELAKPTR